MLETIKKKQDFNSVYRRGKLIKNRDFLIRYLKNEKYTNRLGVVISKKVSKKAVYRNKLRRQIKEYFSHKNNELKQGYDILVTAKPTCFGQDYQTIKKSLDYLLKKVDLINR